MFFAEDLSKLLTQPYHDVMAMLLSRAHQPKRLRPLASVVAKTATQHHCWSESQEDLCETRKGGTSTASNMCDVSFVSRETEERKQKRENEMMRR